MKKGTAPPDVSNIICPDVRKFGACKRDGCKYKHTHASEGTPIEPKIKYEYVAPAYKRPEEIEAEYNKKLEEKKEERKERADDGDGKREYRGKKREYGDRRRDYEESREGEGDHSSTRPFTGRRRGSRGSRGFRGSRGGRNGKRARDEGPADDRVPDYYQEFVQEKTDEELKQEIQKEKAEKAELLDRLKELHEDIKLLLPFKAKLIEKTSLDLMFIMDCTGSMGSWIEACKTQLLNIIDAVNKEHPGTAIRISYIGYRDIKDKNRFEILGFTSDIKKVKDFISIQVADGGADFPEDIAGGLDKALKQDWKAASKYAVLIADAPCHGNKFHGEVGDDYPAGDPEHKDPLKLIGEFAKRNINFYGIKIESVTNKMFNMLSEAYSKIAKVPIKIADLGSDPSSLGFFIQCTVNATISGTIMGSEATSIKNALSELKINKKQELPATTTVKQSEEEKKDAVPAVPVVFPTMMSEDPQWGSLQKSETLQSICRTYFIVKDKNTPINWRKPLLQESQINTEVSICALPFSAGAMRYAFYMEDLKLDQKMVAKLPKVIDSTYCLEHMKKDVETLFICQHLVNEFNDKIVEIVSNTALLMNFVHSFIYEITDNPKYKYCYGENFIEGRYQKFNSNAGWVDQSLTESSLIAQAFSHFSWQMTKGYMMIVDLQGATGVLTDPQIHCIDHTKYGKGNLGYPGIMKFFFTHICNPYCKKLGLIHPESGDSIPADLKFYTQVMNEPEDPTKIVFTICDLCRNGFKIRAGTLYQKRMNSQEKYCNDCDHQRKATMREGTCQVCKSIFRSSEYWFNMKRTEFPTLCSKCRLERRNKMRADLEKK